MVLPVDSTAFAPSIRGEHRVKSVREAGSMYRIFRGGSGRGSNHSIQHWDVPRRPAVQLRIRATEPAADTLSSGDESVSMEAVER
jgi:hypothetical protein